MKKKSIDDLQKDYKRVTGKEPAIRWDKPTLTKKITDAEILQAGYAAKNGAMKKQAAQVGDENPEFEKLAADQVKVTGTKLSESSEPPGDGEDSVRKRLDSDGRGGLRPGAGRPTGQTDLRARCERIMALEVPDLAIGMGAVGLNTALVNLTGVGIDEKPVAWGALADFPHGSPSLALGLTRLLYYWFPSLEGRTDVVTLHLEALFLIFNPFRARAERMNQLIKQQKEKENAEKTQDPQRPVGESPPAPVPAPAAAVDPAAKKPHVKSRRHAKRRR